MNYLKHMSPNLQSTEIKISQKPLRISLEVFGGALCRADRMAGRGKPIADEDTLTSFLLGSMGERNKNRHPNFLVVEKDTTINEIEDTFRPFLNRDDIGIILINQYIVETIRLALDAHRRSIPAVLEIPSNEHPYDAAKYFILRRTKGKLLLKTCARAAQPLTLLSLPGLSQFATLYLSFKPWLPDPPFLFTEWRVSCWGSIQV